MTIDGGSLTTNQQISMGEAAGDTGLLTITANGGSITTVGTSSHLYCGKAGNATLNMSGGTIDIAATLYIARDSTSTVTVNLSGGTIDCNVLNMRTSGGVGTINITSGTLTIDGNATAYVTTCVTNGWIKAYNGAGTVLQDYNNTNPGKTTVWAVIYNKATIPNPISDANNVPVSGTNLSWKAGATAASHNVYFGTVLNDVNSAERLLGDLNGNGIVDFNDVSRLTLYWLANPAGSEPYAGVNDDDIVDFFDYALFSQDWRNTAAPVFKGNQDANSFAPGALAFAATYYWRIDEVNGPNTAKGDVWNFTTQTGKASIRAPANNEINVLSRAVLVWTAGVGAISHDVYFGTADPPVTLVSDNQTATTYNPGTPIANSTTYYWRIDENYGTTTVQGDVWNFTTIDAANEPNFVFVQASDPQMAWGQCGDKDYLWGTTISKINNINPDFMIVTGDLINSSGSQTQADTYKSYAASLNPAIEIYQVPGNHDIGEPPSAPKYIFWKDNFGYSPDNNNPWYSFTYGDSIFIGLDSVVLRSPFDNKDIEEIDWLTTTLADANESGYTHKFVFMHHPLFIKDVNETEERTFPEPRREELRTIFHTYGVNVIFAGHTHTNEYVLDGDLEVITTTSCTCGLGGSPPPGIRIIKVYSNRIEQEYRTLDSLP
jgi:predicted phosphodiesterase